MPLPAPQATNPLVAVVPPPQVPPANPGVVSNPAPITVPPPPPPLPKPEFPALKLQGVFYRSTNSSALINNRTVFVGDEIRNAKVIAIGRQSVTLEFAGEKHVITLY
jgi:hypothetical protein